MKNLRCIRETSYAWCTDYHNRYKTTVYVVWCCCSLFKLTSDTFVLFFFVICQAVARLHATNDRNFLVFSASNLHTRCKRIERELEVPFRKRKGTKTYMYRVSQQIDYNTSSMDTTEVGEQKMCRKLRTR